MNKFGMGLIVGAALSTLACGSSDDKGAANANANANGNGKGGSTSVVGEDSGAPASKNGADGCPVNSGFEGDERCLVVPAEAEGMQVHYGPKNYDDPDEVALYVVAPGDEIDKCYWTKLPNAADVYVSSRHGSMRPGSHHFIARAMADIDMPDGFGDCNQADAIGFADDIGTFQVPDYTYPPAAPDYEGMGIEIPAARQGMLNGHFINQSDKPRLAEAWINYTKTDPATVTAMFMPVSLNGGISLRIPAHTQQLLPASGKHYSCSPTVDTRIFSLQSHMHAHGTRMSAWKVDAQGAKTLVYEGFDWREPAGFNFDSVTTNPASDRVSKTAGAISGPLVVAAGESLEWECDVDNTSDVLLTFRNQVNTGEMCILGGISAAVTGDSVPFACTLN